MNEIDLKFNNSFESCVLLKDSLWFVTIKDNWLCKMSTENYTVEYVCDVPYANVEVYSYKVAGGYDSILILMPMYGEYLLEYDIEKNTFKKIELKQSKIDGIFSGGAGIKFRSSVRDGDKLWILPQSAHCIIEYDFSTHNVIEYTDWYSVFEQFNWTNVPLFGKGIIAMDSIWIPCLQINAVLEFSLDKKVNLHFLGTKDEKFSAITEYKSDLWLMDNRKMSVVTWNPKTGFIKYYNEFPEDYNLQEKYKYDNTNIDYGIWGMNTIDNKIVLSPSTANQFVILDTESGLMRKLVDVPKDSSYIDSYRPDKNHVLYLSQSNNTIGVYSVSDETMEFETFYITVKKSKDEIKDMVLHEKELELKSFLELVV